MDERWLHVTTRAARRHLGAGAASPRCLPRSRAPRAGGGPDALLRRARARGHVERRASGPRRAPPTSARSSRRCSRTRARSTCCNNLNMQSRDKGPGGDGHHRGVLHMFTGTEMHGREQRRRRLGRSEDRAGDRRRLAVRVAAVRGAHRLRRHQLAADLVGAGPRGAADAEPVGRLHARLRGRDAERRQQPATPPPTPDGRPAHAARSTTRSPRSTALRTRLRRADRERLDSYQESLRDIERRAGRAWCATTAGRRRRARRRRSAASVDVEGRGATTRRSASCRWT